MSHYIQYALTVLLVLMLSALTDPFMYWMPTMPTMFALTVACVSLIVWMGFVMRETARDEREAEHRMFAGRVAYLVGIAGLTCALLIQGISHEIDPWIPGTLVLMVISKVFARLYAETFW